MSNTKQATSEARKLVNALSAEYKAVAGTASAELERAKVHLDHFEAYIEEHLLAHPPAEKPKAKPAPKPKASPTSGDPNENKATTTAEQGAAS